MSFGFRQLNNLVVESEDQKWEMRQRICVFFNEGKSMGSDKSE